MVPIIQRDAGLVMTILCFWTVVLIKASSKKAVPFWGSLTELDVDLHVFILGFYLSLWETPV